MQFILSIFINLYMFPATMSPSSGVTTAFMRHLVLWMTLVCTLGAYQTVIYTE